MEHDSTQGQIAGIQLYVGLKFHRTIDYDRKAMRRALVKGAAVVRKEARTLVSARVVSEPGEFPGQVTGAMRRAIGVIGKGSKGGWIKVGVRAIPGNFYYPAVLFYGSTTRNIRARGNFMTTALANRGNQIREQVRDALRQALRPR
ncbi:MULTISPECIES: hypothetical protein [unclassified Xanthomonas]|uniref:hypothetical protein n=1 Tax=unclassified Xanthomonas TaxID=2643310 RepID=UPI0005F2B368|nr:MULTISPECIES: hypothetical protein [unclassified Xanthomonas]